jgi:hypothetical protein
MLAVVDHVQINESDGRFVILDSEKNYFYAISKSGADFLHQIREHGRFDLAVKEISKAYKIDRQFVEDDMKVFIQKLLEKELVVTR